jgi:hypothetical protein
MTAAMSDVPPADGWTTDDLDDLPEDGVRRELLDGVLHVSPSPSSIHQVIAARLLVALERTCPDHLYVSQAWGTFADTIKIDEPWRIEIPIDGLRPRNM